MAKNDSVLTIDCNYMYPEFAAAYLIAEKGAAAFVDNNTGRAVPLLMKTLKDRGLAPEQVRYLIVTHVHLDHAGGTSGLVKLLPNATVLAHPRAAVHLVNPERLIAGAKSVYGEEKYLELYPDIGPIDAQRVRAVQDGETVKLGEREIKFVFTLGHAKHHMCVYDSGTNGIFTGDSFGLAFPLVQNGTAPFIFPTTPPPDFDPVEAEKAVAKITGTGAERVYLAHFGERRDVAALASMMTAYIAVMADMLEQAKRSGREGSELESFCYMLMRNFFEKELGARKIGLSGFVEKFLDLDIRLSAKGIAHAAARDAK